MRQSRLRIDIAQRRLAVTDVLIVYDYVVYFMTLVSFVQIVLNLP